MTNTIEPMIEQDCTIEHNGRKITSGGAIVTETHLIAYPAENGVLNDWHGNKLGTWRAISSRPAIFFGHHSCYGSHFYFMRANVNGRQYSLRGFGIGMLARGKAIKA